MTTIRFKPGPFHSYFFSECKGAWEPLPRYDLSNFGRH